MGWASGSSLFSEVWSEVRKHIPDQSHVTVCAKVMEAFENEDCDTLSECFDEDMPEIEKAYYDVLHPDYKEDEANGL